MQAKPPPPTRPPCKHPHTQARTHLPPRPQVQTAVMGDIHHYALRCRHANETVYIQERDRHRFGDWEPLQCNTEECVEVRPSGGGGWLASRPAARCRGCACRATGGHVAKRVHFLVPALPSGQPAGSWSPRHSPAVVPTRTRRGLPSPAQAHTNVDVRVDIPAFRALLADRLPLVFAGWPVEAAAIPWPVQEGAE